MEIPEITSHEDLLKRLAGEPRSYLLIYKKGSPLSESAYLHVSQAVKNLDQIRVFSADVSRTRDIHPVYRISSAPVLLEFEKTSLKNVIKGTHDPGFYQSLFEDALFIAQAAREGRHLKSVTVYTTPMCSWCNTLKSYLRQHRIRFTEIDVSRDESAAREMQQRSGQQGVPQTLINGEMVVGFDQSKINRLLEINN